MAIFCPNRSSDFFLFLVVFGRTLFDFSADDIDGVAQSLGKYRNSVTIVVNVASEWGLAKYHYPQLQKMYEDLEDQGLRNRVKTYSMIYSKQSLIPKCVN